MSYKTVETSDNASSVDGNEALAESADNKAGEGLGTVSIGSASNISSQDSLVGLSEKEKKKDMAGQVR